MPDTTPIGAHMSALLSLRSKSLQAYGLNPQDLMVPEKQALAKIPDKETRALAKISHRSRALAVESEHHLTVI